MPQVQQAISLLVAPVVIISACGLLCLAFYNRLAALVNRARLFLKERFDTASRLSRMPLDDQAGPDAHLLRLRNAILDRQVDAIVRRARLIRASLACLLTTILCMLACSLTLGLTVLLRVEWLAMTFFALGICTMAAAIIFALRELVRSLDPLLLEQNDVVTSSPD